MSIVRPASIRADASAPLLCLHSSGSTGRQWQSMTAALSPRFSVVAPDLVGYADTLRWPTGKPASLDDEVERLAPLLSANGIDVLAHSYGAAVALQIALRWPERVRSLTLYEPVRFALLFGDPQTQAAGEWIVGVGRRIGLDVMSGNLRAAAARFVDYWSGEGAWVSLSPRHQHVLAERMPKVHAEFEALFADPVPASAVGEFAMPVHLIGGSRSPLPVRMVLDVLADALPRATRTTLAGLGHMAPVTDPQRVAASLPAWLRAAPLAAAA
jgi:pimeloyl-ACP methyl ester carboxylesterase